MIYYKVKPNSDQTPFNNTILVRNELYTKIQLKAVNPNFIKTHFDEVEINKNNTYYFFGARFSKQYPYNQ